MTEHQPESPALPGVTRWRTPRTVPGVEREAIRLVLGNLAEAGTWVRSHGQECHYDGTDLLIGTPGDYIRVIPGEWVVRNPDSFWGFGHDVFQAETFAETYEPAPGPLVLPPDEFRAVQVVAAVLGVPGSASEPDGPATEATRSAEDISIKIARALYDSIDRCARCKVCEHQCGAAAKVAIEAVRVERARAESAGAKLAEVEALCRDARASAPESVRAPSVAVVRILAIIGSDEKGPGNG